MLMLSGPSELLVLLFLIAWLVCSAVISMCWCSSCVTCRMIFLLILLLVCLTGVVKCLLKALAMWVSLCSGLVKLIVMFLC